ncbi:hypothetical protein WMF04_44140 [Sorangium sp. So ce260]|uniref:imine reductase family protein n=1 Tax=Sorangium sp. So ce260 TaxID=3133291 RepID=UPI003F61F2D4
MAPARVRGRSCTVYSDNRGGRQRRGRAPRRCADSCAGAGASRAGRTDLTKLVSASTEQGVSAEVLQPVHQMIRRQIAAGHGKEGFARIFEELRSTR